MSAAYYSSVDRYWEVFCSKGDVVEITDKAGSISTRTVIDCTLTMFTFLADSNAITMNRKSILSMAHPLKQSAQMGIYENDLVVFCNKEEKKEPVLGVITSVSRTFVSVFQLSGVDKNETKEVWLKAVSLIGRGFSIPKYYELREYKLNIEYGILYRVLNKCLVPDFLQHEIGIFRIRFELERTIPIINKITGILQNGSAPSEEDRLENGFLKGLFKRKQSKRLDSLVDSSSCVDDLHSSTSSTEAEDPMKTRSLSVSPPPMLLAHTEQLLRTYQLSFLNTKEKLVQMWLNVNERVVPKKQRLKKESSEHYVKDEDVDTIVYYQSLEGNKKAEQYKNMKSDRKSCIALTKYNLKPIQERLGLPPIPLITQKKLWRKKSVCFSVNVICHEYPYEL